MSRRGRTAALAAAVACLPVTAHAAAPPPPRPNIIHILADDLGYGDVGFNGQTLIKTPIIDSIATGGMILRNGYCPAPVCAPSRVSLMTGFHSGHAYVDSNRPDASNAPRAEDMMLPQILKNAGYATGMIGKWGFGTNGAGTETVISPDALPNVHGFDYFYGYLSHVRAQNYFEPYLWQTNSAAQYGVEQTPTNNTYTEDLFISKSLQYVTDHANKSQPFYLQFSPTIPHFSLDQISLVPNWDQAYSAPAYAAWTTKQKEYAAMITRLDVGIGLLLAKLNDPNGDGDKSDSIVNNTLIVFTSDNGPSNVDGAPIDFFDSAGPFRGGKSDLYEGGIHAPWAMRWTGTIRAGSIDDRVIDGTDFLPTAAALAGAETPVGIDGVSFAPDLTGTGVSRNRPYFIYEDHEPMPGPAGGTITATWAIRQGDYKLIEFSDGSYQMYNLAADPGETRDISAQNPLLQQQLTNIALAEDVEQPEGFAVTYRTWRAATNTARVADDINWSGDGAPADNWSAVVVNNTSSGAMTALVDQDLSFLGFGVRGDAGPQRVQVNPGVTLYGRNEIRIGNNGTIDLQGGTLSTNRWVDVRPGGTLTGFGSVNGMIYNDGVVSVPAARTLRLNDGGVHTGAFVLMGSGAGDATLEFAHGDHTLAPGSSISGSGVVFITGASVHADATLSVPLGVTVRVDGGQLAAPTISAQGRIDFRSGSISAANLQLQGAAARLSFSGHAQAMKVASLTMDNSAKLDVGDGKLIVSAGNVGSWNGSGYTGISGLIASGRRDDGSWSGNGIVTTQSAAIVPNALTSVGVASASDAARAGGTFGGFTVAAADVLVAYTYTGDANLDGVISGDDYFAIDSAFPQRLTGWINGDFNYDGRIDGDDYFYIDSNFRAQTAPIPMTGGSGGAVGFVAVPEPSCLALVLPLLHTIVSRRRAKKDASTIARRGV
jgi:arylsulfatase A-like enzyme